MDRPGRLQGRAERVLVVTNMWPSTAAPVRGIFVQEQVASLRAVAPDRHFDLLVIDGRRGRSEYLRAIPRLRRVLGEHRYDVIHAHYGLTGAVATMQKSCPVVVTYHGSDVYIPWQRTLSRYAARRAGGRVAVSREVRARLCVPETDVIPCGVDLERFQPRPRDEARQRLGLSRAGTVLLFPASPANPVKDYALFSAAVDALPPSLRNDVHVLVLADIPREEVPWYFSAADLMMLTSRHEGSPNVVREAMACNLPIVSVDVGDVAEAVTGIDNSAVVTRSPDSLAAAAEAVLVSGRRSNARSRLLDRGLDAAAVARRLLAVYDRIFTDANRLADGTAVPSR